jgi:hypothetical protein
MTLYKAGRKYVAARSNECGYANYEIVPAPNQLGARGGVARPIISMARL